MNSGKIDSVLDRIQEQQTEFIEKCKEYDNLQVKYLSWEVLFEVLKKLDSIPKDSILDFKQYCFLQNKNLKQIPYLNLTHELRQSQEEPKAIKRFFRIKIISKP